MKSEGNTKQKRGKELPPPLFGLNFGMTDHLHDVMHGKDGINGVKHSGSAADGYSSQGSKLLESAVESLNG